MLAMLLMVEFICSNVTAKSDSCGTYLYDHFIQQVSSAFISASISIPNLCNSSQRKYILEEYSDVRTVSVLLAQDS